MTKINKKSWIWDRTRIILKNPNNEDVILTSEDLNDQTLNYIFEDIEKYVQEEGGEIE
tara:strand:- start:373 stop:546 length:174 start_codon:yes stop_codon:yes gene_type:complete